MSTDRKRSRSLGGSAAALAALALGVPAAFAQGAGSTNDVRAIGVLDAVSRPDTYPWTYCTGQDGNPYIEISVHLSGPLYSDDPRLEGHWDGVVLGQVNTRTIRGYVHDVFEIRDFETGAVKVKAVAQTFADGAWGGRGTIFGDVCGPGTPGVTVDVCGEGRRSVGLLSTYFTITFQGPVFPHAVQYNPDIPLPRPTTVDPSTAILEIGGPTPAEPFDVSVVQTGSCLDDPAPGFR